MSKQAQILEDVALLMQLVEQMNGVVSRLKMADVEVYLQQVATREDPLSTFAAVRITMKTQAEYFQGR